MVKDEDSKGREEKVERKGIRKEGNNNRVEGFQ
jgi:hypothetical protein